MIKTDKNLSFRFCVGTRKYPKERVKSRDCNRNFNVTKGIPLKKWIPFVFVQTGQTSAGPAKKLCISNRCFALPGREDALPSGENRKVRQDFDP